MSTSSPSITQLFQGAADQGNLSSESMKVLQVIDLGAQIQEALGGNAADFGHSEVVLVSQMIDDSGSIRTAGNSEAVREGHNLVISSLQGSKQSKSIMAMTRYLNGQILYPYGSLDQAVKMTTSNYNPNKGTPLYDETVALLAAVLAKTEEFSNNGIPVRTVTLILTDGEDVHSHRHNAADVKTLVDDMHRQESHIIAALGVDSGSTDFRRVFKEMGIRDEWILTPGNSPSEIRKAFGTFSQSAVSASQGGASFSQVALGGFGAP